MSLNIEQIEKSIAVHESDIQKVGDSVIRFTRKAGKEPYAVYYLDLGKDLPNTQDEINKYQDSVIGPYYFEGKRSLQWNNYLYFIVSNECLSKEEVLQAKELIERDRSYARKFVISEDELDLVFEPTKLQSIGNAPRPSILSYWTNCLTEAGIDKAILSKNSMPKKLKMIEKSSLKPKYEPRLPETKVES